VSKFQDFGQYLFPEVFSANYIDISALNNRFLKPD
jgi:hypothetical protein